MTHHRILTPKSEWTTKAECDGPNPLRYICLIVWNSVCINENFNGVLLISPKDTLLLVDSKRSKCLGFQNIKTRELMIELIKKIENQSK